MTKEKRLILDGSPCDTNFYENGPKTVAEAISQGKSLCPYFEKCQKSNHYEKGWQCLMQQGLEVAQYVVKQGNTISEEVNGDFKKFFMEKGLNPPEGFIWSPNRKDFEVIRDKQIALAKVQEFATLVIHDTREINSP